METYETRSWAEHAERLATATVDQFAYRFDMGKEGAQLLDRMKFRDFYLSISNSETSTNALVLAKHKKPFDFPRDYMQHYELRNPTPIADIDIYPRGIILSSRIKEDIRRSGQDSFLQKMKAIIVNINKAIGPKVAPIFGKQGKHAFPSEVAYLNLLKDRDISDLLIDSSNKESFFGFLRVDYHSLVPRDNEPGWLPPKQVDWIESFPVIIVPGLETEQLEVMVKKENYWK